MRPAAPLHDAARATLTFRVSGESRFVNRQLKTALSHMKGQNDDHLTDETETSDMVVCTVSIAHCHYVSSWNLMPPSLTQT